ncbi:hypothetical protein ACU8KH_03265 [Lachancea thermotolerans]
MSNIGNTGNFGNYGNIGSIISHVVFGPSQLLLLQPNAVFGTQKSLYAAAAEEGWTLQPLYCACMASPAAAVFIVAVFAAAAPGASEGL